MKIPDDLAFGQPSLAPALGFEASPSAWAYEDVEGDAHARFRFAAGPAIAGHEERRRASTSIWTACWNHPEPLQDGSAHDFVHAFFPDVDAALIAAQVEADG